MDKWEYPLLVSIICWLVMDNNNAYQQAQFSDLS